MCCIYFFLNMNNMHLFKITFNIFFKTFSIFFSKLILLIHCEAHCASRNVEKGVCA